jgi:hypothetical protein
LMLKSESGSRKCSYPFRPSHSGFKRTESTRDCSMCFPEKSLWPLRITYLARDLGSVMHCGWPESCNKSKEKFSVCWLYSITSIYNKDCVLVFYLSQ